MKHDHRDAVRWSPDAMIDRLGGDEELARQLIALFLAEYPRMMAAVRESVSGGRAEAIRQAAHGFKGSVGNFTDGAPATTAFELECMARQNRVQDAPAVLARLEEDVARFVAALRRFERERTCAS
jgi:HPt (histidine-containing phosphotransfer) domain-containing protein